MSSAAPKVKVSVEYCKQWGYKSKYDRLASRLLAHAAKDGSLALELVGNTGRVTAFEITVQKAGDDKPTTIYSKLAKGVFPDDESLYKAIKEWASSGKVIEVSEMV